jgi:peptide/nickel transport system ATP-binding protein|tara:strand:- start:278 stop:1249 length:972 start_codon:yes stop_codon:yes gene_type:complete
MAKEEILLVKDLHTYFESPRGTVRAIQNFSLSLSKKQVLGIIGESGAGKTTIGLSIMRLLGMGGHIETGTVHLEKQDILSLPEAEMRSIRGKDISMTFENSSSILNPSDSVGDQIRETIQIHTNLTYKESNELTLQSLNEIGMQNARKVMDMQPRELSAGACQKVMLVMSTILQPKVLIADEITRSLDIITQAQISDHFRRRISETDISTLLLTNDPGILAQLADTAIVIYKGRKLEQAPIREIFKRPMHPYTFQLLRPMENRKLKTIRSESIAESVDPDMCPLVEKCQRAISKCRTSEMPQDSDIDGVHQVACYNPILVAID